MNPHQRMQLNAHQAALLAARVWLETGHGRFICLALNAPYDGNPAPEGSIERALQDYIIQELKGHTLISWLEAERGVYLPLHYHAQCRLAWIDKMMEIFA